ncbi:MAG TPA: hypothetical protein VGK10_01020 [Prolixibacteraceae bacterium]|jgi:hypothetical protein
MNYFENVRTLEELRKQYRNLAFANHPDRGGETAVMQEINNQYEKLSQKLIEGNESFSDERKEWEHQVSEELRQKLDKVIFLPNIIIELIGSWIWITGNTYAIRALLKEEGFKFSSPKSAWYFHSGEYIKKSGILLSMEELKDLWGYQNIESKAYNQGNQLN